MDMRNLKDQALLDELRAAQNDVVSYGSRSHVFHEAAWQRLVEGLRELERRYPPEAQPQH
jgi:hypothetical protein